MSTAQTFANYDRLLGGGLREQISTARQEGRSYERIARDLAATGIEVSGETVRRWCALLDLEVAS